MPNPRKEAAKNLQHKIHKTPYRLNAPPGMEHPRRLGDAFPTGGGIPRFGVSGFNSLYRPDSPDLSGSDLRQHLLSVVDRWSKVNMKARDTMLELEGRQARNSRGMYGQDGRTVLPMNTYKPGGKAFQLQKEQWTNDQRAINVLREYFSHSSLSKEDMKLLDKTVGARVTHGGSQGFAGGGWGSRPEERFTGKNLWRDAAQLIDNLDAINRDLARKRRED